MVSQLPVVRIRAGAVSCAVWENDVKPFDGSRTILTATITRRYKGEDGEWKSSQSFAKNEIPLAVHCLEKAFEAIIERDNQQSRNSGFDENVVV